MEPRTDTRSRALLWAAWLVVLVVAAGSALAALSLYVGSWSDCFDGNEPACSAPPTPSWVIDLRWGGWAATVAASLATVVLTRRYSRGRVTKRAVLIGFACVTIALLVVLYALTRS